jgi:hypothetical protein
MMGLFGKKHKAAENEEIHPPINMTASKRQPLLVENSYSSDDIDTPPSWGERVGPIRLEDEWGKAPMPESRDPDPELGVMVPFGASEARTSPQSPPHSTTTSLQSSQMTQQHYVQHAASSDEEAFARMREGPLPNPETLVMAQLIQWKFAAEEGSMALRVPAVMCAVGVMITTVSPYFLEVGCLTPGHIILSCFILTQGVLICIIDGRSHYARDPLGSRAKLRNFITRHLNVLRLVWGRGMLYLLVGLLNIAHETLVCYVSGGLMMTIGIIAILSGLHAYHNLSTLRQSLSDENFLLMEFMKHDENHDGYLNSSEFAQFIWDLGLEFDDLYTLKAFNTIDANHDQRINFRQFARWWHQVRLNSDSQIS